jgi:cell division septum initiation protein DivIVA
LQRAGVVSCILAVVIEHDPFETNAKDELLPSWIDQRRAAEEERDPVPPSLREVAFPTAVRGYEKRAVDGYVERVNRLITELEVSRSPQAAVRHALDRVGEQTSGILHRARATAEEITISAREEAEETTGRARAEAREIIAEAKAEADGLLARSTAAAEDLLARAGTEANDLLSRSRAEADSTLAESRAESARHLEEAHQETTTLVAAAESRRADLAADTEAIREERLRLLAAVGDIAARLGEVAAAAAARFAPAEEAEAEGAEQAVAGVAGEPVPDELAADDDLVERPADQHVGRIDEPA